MSKMPYTWRMLQQSLGLVHPMAGNTPAITTLATRPRTSPAWWLLPKNCSEDDYDHCYLVSQRCCGPKSDFKAADCTWKHMAEVFNGDTDACVSYEGTRTAIEKVGFGILPGGAGLSQMTQMIISVVFAYQTPCFLRGDFRWVSERHFGEATTGHGFITNLPPQ